MLHILGLIYLVPHASASEMLLELGDASIEDLLSEDMSSEKLSADTIDCADEAVLRLAFSMSFLTGSDTTDCLKKSTEAAWAEGGSGHKLMKPPEPGGSGGSGWTKEQVENRIKARCTTKAGHGIALGPRLIRMTFHDAADFHNLQFANGTKAPESMGAVDSCLHTALLSTGVNQADDDDDVEAVAKGDPNHNRGLGNAVKWVIAMASSSKLTRPDAQVLGANVALEEWFNGPEVSMAYGRETGSCRKPVCSSEKCWSKLTPFFKQPVAEPVGGGMFCPMTNTLEPLRTMLGLSVEELVALQGAHSVGGVIVCSGLGNVASGPYCPAKCGAPPGDFFEGGNLDGTVFDDTPGKFDNRYYQLLMDEDYENLPACGELRRNFPHLSKRGLSGAGELDKGGSGLKKRKQDFSKTCSAGVHYEPESQCDVEECEETCEKSEDCKEAQNADDTDKMKFEAAWKNCLICKKRCIGTHRKKMDQKAAREGFRPCLKACDTKPGCNRNEFQTCRTECKKIKGKARRECMNKCKEKVNCWRDCRKQCQDARKSAFENKGEKLPARWCKRLSSTNKCLDPNVKMPPNGGFGDCPEDKRVSFPNLGKGRLTVIQNLERWTTFRGLHKRLMVLPSDWSYLADPKLKALFKKYGTNQVEFFKQYTSAWGKISTKGWEGKLSTCKSVPCTRLSGGISCPVAAKGIGSMKWAGIFKKNGLASDFKRPKNLSFVACEPQLPDDDSACELIGGYGVKAKVKCGAYTGYCLTAEASKAQGLIKEEWKKGGQTAECKAELLSVSKAKPSFLNQGAVMSRRRRRTRSGALRLSSKGSWQS